MTGTTLSSQPGVSVAGDTHSPFALVRKLCASFSLSRAWVLSWPSAVFATTAMILAPLPASAMTAYYGDSMYLLVDGPTWQEAQANAEIIGGNLVTINNAEEDYFLSSTFGLGLWIGITDKDEEGVFKWISGEAVTYTNWEPSQPDNHLGGQNYGWYHVGYNGQWDDICPFGGCPAIQGIAEVKLASGTSAGTSVPGPLPILGLGVVFGFSRQLRKRIKRHRETSSVATSLGACSNP